MFGFLKQKIKEAVGGISKSIEEEGKEEVKEIPKEIKTAEKLVSEVKEKKGFFSKLKDKFTKKEVSIEEAPEKELEEVSIEKIEKEREEELVKEKIQREAEEAAVRISDKLAKKEIPSVQDLAAKKKGDDLPKTDKELIEKFKKIKEEAHKEVKEEEKKGIFSIIKEKIVTKTIDEKKFDELFWQLEVVLLENNVAVEVIDKIKEDLKANIVNKPIKRGKIEETIETSLKDTIGTLLDIEQPDLASLIKAKEKKPFVICFIGINGSGKTTSIAKFTNYLLSQKLSVVLAAADTFRAAAIDQLQKHGEKLGVKVIKHDYGSDAAAVAFDAIKHASAKNVDVVIIDTAGRMHSNVNLMDELKKVIRVTKPDFKIFVGESITGNDCVEQAKSFNTEVGIDGIILSKADIDDKGGAAISVSYVTGKPIIFIGMGQEYSDLKKFEPHLILESLGL